MKVKIKRLSPDAIMPTRGTDYSAGLDLYALESYVIKPRDRQLIKTGIAFQIPEGYMGMVVGRSGNTIKKGLTARLGIVDSDYRADVGIMAFNENGESMIVTKGERVGQIVITPYLHVELEEAEELDVSGRGENGFGSTGN